MNPVPKVRLATSVTDLRHGMNGPRKGELATTFVENVS
jgi:hypothetical protein